MTLPNFSAALNNVVVQYNTVRILQVTMSMSSRCPKVNAAPDP